METATRAPTADGGGGGGIPAQTFAKLSPHEYLLSSLSGPSHRTNGRSAEQSRRPNVTFSSLTHAHGSALVRTGDTTAICGVRGETMLAADIPSHRPVVGVVGVGVDPASDRASGGAGVDELRGYDLLVPNIELATGSAPQFLPGGPPSTLAQVVSTRVYSMLHASRLVDAADLRIWRSKLGEGQGRGMGRRGDSGEDDEMQVDDDDDDDDDAEEEEAGDREVVAYWVLYIDVFFVSFDGNALDVAWAAVLAALKDTALPHAYWDADREAVLCTRSRPARRLRVKGLPVALTAGIFAARDAPDRPQEEEDDARIWILTDPDAMEEKVCGETATAVVDCSGGEVEVIAVVKSGGGRMGEEVMTRFVGELAPARWREWAAAMEV